MLGVIGLVDLEADDLAAVQVQDQVQVAMPDAAWPLPCRGENYAERDASSPQSNLICHHSTRHSFLPSQSVEKLQQSIIGSEAADPRVEWYRHCERCLFQSDVRVQVLLRGLNRFMSQPEGDD